MVKIFLFKITLIFYKKWNSVVEFSYCKYLFLWFLWYFMGLLILFLSFLCNLLVTGNRYVSYYSVADMHCATKGELLASAGDDGNVILWVPSELSSSNFGSDRHDDKESWRAKHMCRSSGAEIYDLAWSPDAAHFIIGSMDNIARIYNATTGKPT